MFYESDIISHVMHVSVRIDKSEMVSNFFKAVRFCVTVCCSD